FRVGRGASGTRSVKGALQRFVREGATGVPRAISPVAGSRSARSAPATALALAGSRNAIGDRTRTGSATPRGAQPGSRGSVAFRQTTVRKPHAAGSGSTSQSGSPFLQVWSELGRPRRSVAGA